MALDRRTFLKTGMAGIGAATLAPSVLAQTPGVRPAPNMPAPNFVATNGINMAVYEQGEPGNPAIVFCHGFPELAYSWRYQMGPVSAAGYHCLSPDQRGFGLTGGPEDPSQYDLQYFCDDLIGMLDAKGIEKAVFCGHDWGGAVVWSMGRLYPDRCAGIIGLNTGARRPADLPPLEDPEPSLIVRTPNYYVATFMTPGGRRGAS